MHFSKTFWEAFGTLLRPSWDRFGSILGKFWKPKSMPTSTLTKMSKLHLRLDENQKIRFKRIEKASKIDAKATCQTCCEKVPKIKSKVSQNGPKRVPRGLQKEVKIRLQLEKLNILRPKSGPRTNFEKESQKRAKRQTCSNKLTGSAFNFRKAWKRVMKNWRSNQRKTWELGTYLGRFWSILGPFLETFWGPGGLPRASPKENRFLTVF